MNQELVHLANVDRLDREVARLDLELTRLDQRLATLTKSAADRERARVEAKAAADANKTEERALSRKAEEYGQSRKAALRVLETGVGNAEAAQRQLERCDALIDEAETGVLELMERQDQLDTALHAAERSAKEAQEALTIELANQPSRKAELDTQRLAALEQRRSAASVLAADVRSRYEAFRERGRWAVSVITGGACSACSMVVQPQMLNDLHKDQIVACHGCHRWLVEA